MSDLEKRIIGYLAVAGLIAVCLINGHPGWVAFFLILIAVETLDVF